MGRALSSGRRWPSSSRSCRSSLQASMGLALAGELNGYPGPKHVLELAAELDLSEDQRRAVQRNGSAPRRGWRARR